MKDQAKFPNAARLLVEALDPERPVFGAFSLEVYQNGSVYRFHEGCGEDTLFDLASLTKPLVTTTLAALAVSKRIFTLDTSVQTFFPSLKSSKVTISHLLNHCGGFPAWLPLHDEFHEPESKALFNALETPKLARERYEHRILESFSEELFLKQCVYSDLGFMLLGWILEKSCGAPLDALFQEWVAQLYGYTNLQFLPISPDIAPTGYCKWRGHVLRGEVHDDNCYVLGGVAGHAGLFGTAEEVTQLALEWLKAVNDSTQAPSLLLNPEIARTFWRTNHVPGSVRSLGWDGISRNPENMSESTSSAGQFFSNETRGHLGWTGTSLWIDPRNDLIVTLLTNRVHVTDSHDLVAIKKFRPRFHDLLLQDLGISKP